MTAEPPTTRVEDLDFHGFIDYAVSGARQRVPEADAEAMRLVLMLHRLTSLMVYDLEASVHRPRGWSWSGFRVMFALWLTNPLEAWQVAEFSGMSRAAVSSLVNTLERNGLVARTPSDARRRTVSLALTEAGRTAMEEAVTAHHRREQLWASAISRRELRTLVRLLARLLHHPEADLFRRRD
ncbi:MAG: MarR family winged helix-turn-helix transcriptional regulator [Carbonactinosporaceae bacterium]